MLKILESGTRLEKPDNAACAPEMYAISFQIMHARTNISYMILVILTDILQ